jgi:hypothetical protein
MCDQLRSDRLLVFMVETYFVATACGAPRQHEIVNH